MTKQLKHWSDDVSNCDVAELKGITTRIDSCLVGAATSFIEIGHALNRARVLIPGDLEFGQWRDQHTRFTARQANNYMKVARKFSTHSLVPKTSLSVLVELSSAPPELADKVEKAIDAGETVKRGDVQKAKKKLAEEVYEEAILDQADDEMEDERRPQPSDDIIASTSVVEAIGLMDSPPPEVENTLPAGDYEMIAVTEDEFDLVIAALNYFTQVDPTADVLAKRLNP